MGSAVPSFYCTKPVYPFWSIFNGSRVLKEGKGKLWEMGVRGAATKRLKTLLSTWHKNPVPEIPQ